MVQANWPKIVKKFVDEAKVSTDRQLTTGLYTNIGEIYAKHSPSTNDAETHWYKALAVEPRNRRASQHLERLFRAARRFPDLIKVYEQRAEHAATKEERVSALLALAELYVRELKNKEAAVEAHKQGLHVHGHVPAGMRPLDAVRAGYDEVTHINFIMMQAMPQVVVDKANTAARLEGPANYGKDVDLDSPAMKAFYAELGFAACSAHYLEDEIEHVDMLFLIVEDPLEQVAADIVADALAMGDCLAQRRDRFLLEGEIGLEQLLDGLADA